MSATQMSFVRSSTQKKIDKIKAIISDKPLTVREISQQIYLATRWAYEYIGRLHAAGEIYIAKYEFKNRYPTAAYQLGKRPDAPRPKPDTTTENARKARERLYADPEAHEFALARRRAKRIKPRRDEITSALFGSNRSNTEDNNGAV